MKGDTSRLTFEQKEILLGQVLPTARRWVDKYPVGSNMHRHAQQTLAYWGEESE